MGAEMAARTVSGHVEIDGADFGGYVKNRKENRKDCRLAINCSGKRRCVTVMRERNGKTLPFVCESEGEALPTILQRVKKRSTVYADEASCWDAQHARFATKRINHSVNFKDEDACTNQAESYFSRLRQTDIGAYYHISGRYLHAYANEMAWREDNCRKPNGTLYCWQRARLLGIPYRASGKGTGRDEPKT